MTTSLPPEKIPPIDVSLGMGMKITGGEVKFENITKIGHQTVIQNEPKFVKANLEDFNSKNFPFPNRDVIRNYIDTIYKERLLILGGGADIDKADLARYLAWELKRITKGKYPVLEWQRS